MHIRADVGMIEISEYLICQLSPVLTIRLKKKKPTSRENFGKI